MRCLTVLLFVLLLLGFAAPADAGHRSWGWGYNPYDRFDHPYYHGISVAGPTFPAYEYVRYSAPRYYGPPYLPVHGYYGRGGSVAISGRRFSVIVGW